ncbi:hypothetical protein GWI33_015228 [Rhynchophorus ferrugineus]|uniref:RWD domain-containing protein n=1 Tax=Rhynchophorus ferrugineus TaxID=354439 RepID=A0A834I5S0_RHYFE|nr:hypothetical protein GWI33_015228 [Rhynchophorus ferrugineus]
MSEMNIKENLQVQLDELESLQSMFYNPGEIRIEDQEAFSNIKDYVAGESIDVPYCLNFSVNLLIDGEKFEVCVKLNHDYPYVKPDIYVRNDKLKRNQHFTLNKKIEEILCEFPRGEPCIFVAISWLQDNANNYIELDESNISLAKIEEPDELVRYWIYSHHIYSKTKRKAIMDLANQMNISGFVMPGKPGIICVEGSSRDVVDWWQNIKSMNWKKIFCKISESNKDDTQSDNFLKFEDFVEKVFDNHGPKYNHMDMGELYKYLEEHNLGYIFKDIFGVEART